ncbi:MAG: DUF1549 domain-containing protein [Acidobacteria bacterium]|nr:DUF1549 domain-containing protein [Acidobacteriota bacterium]
MRLSAALILMAAAARAQQPDLDAEPAVDHANCSLFGPAAERHREARLRQLGRGSSARGELTGLVASRLAAPTGSYSLSTRPQADPQGTIDRHLFEAMAQAGVKPAEPATDAEFLRRVTLDLTGRIPTEQQAREFLADRNDARRTHLIENLFRRPEWASKWTTFFGDLYRNNSNSTQVRRFPEGAAAFNAWIRSSLESAKPYDRMARELIAPTGDHSYEDGQLNWLVGGFVTGGPVQDIYDQQAANVADVFLGISHMNCILCHSGRNRLDTLSLWGRSATRMSAWGLAGYFARTNTRRAAVTPGQPQPYYWAIDNAPARTASNYRLNTTTGNRPARVGSAEQPTVAPVYPFSGKGPNPGENYRDALAREVTADFQFARAAVNYIWAAFFGRGLVDPVNTFDPARLDPDNPPPGPWTLQPSHPRLLNALAQEFINARYDLKWLMRQIVTSNAYQLSARYNGDWNPAWESLYARKLVRRLWAEEVHDAVVLSSGVPASYPSRPNDPYGTLSWAMNFPEPLNTPNNGGVRDFLDAFLRGDRDDELRKDDGSIAQALNLMNDPFIMNRVRVSTTPASSLLRSSLSLPDPELVDRLFLAVLSRYPRAQERLAAVEQLQSPSRDREVENLLWALYNKVDFLFNY